LDFCDAAAVSLSAAEARVQEDLNQFPSKSGANDVTAEGEDIHVIVFHPLMS
jgi:hypothetical protein